MDNTEVVETTPKPPDQTVAPAAPTFVGNSNDLMAVIATTIAAISATCCLTWGYAIYCLPIVGIVAGAAALISASSAQNPERTRRWGWISVGVSGSVLLAMAIMIFCFIAFYAAIIAAAVAIPATPTRIR